MAKKEDQFPDAQIEQLPLSRIIYSWLRKEILSGHLEPGKVLRQEDLANHFHCSRVPLREALNHLEAEGFVTLRPRRGYVVTPLDPADLLELLQLRIVVEEHAGYVAAQRRTTQHVRDLEVYLREMDKLPLNAPRAVHVDRWMLLNQNFHDALDAASGRSHLMQVSSNVRDKVAPYIRLELTMTRQIEEAQADHHEIFEAFRDGDAPLLAGLCRRHCERTAVRFIASLQAKGYAGDLTPAMVTDTTPRGNANREPTVLGNSRR